VTAEGLVGRVDTLEESTSTVLLLNDQASSASALLGTSRLNGVVRGSTSGELVMDFIPQGPTFAVGEVVLTSGLGGRFPKGIVIGTIESIETQANAVFQKALVDPSVDFGSLELVLVITNFDVNESLPDFDTPATITGTIQAEGAPLVAPGTLTETVPTEGAGGEQTAPVEEPPVPNEGGAAPDAPAAPVDGSAGTTP
jgi:hypothetical protein